MEMNSFQMSWTWLSWGDYVSVKQILPTKASVIKLLFTWLVRLEEISGSQSMVNRVNSWFYRSPMPSPGQRIEIRACEGRLSNIPRCFTIDKPRKNFDGKLCIWWDNYDSSENLWNESNFFLIAQLAGNWLGWVGTGEGRENFYLP